jgi:hypothetical protein
MHVLIIDSQDNFYYHHTVYVWSLTLRLIGRRMLRISHFLCCTRYNAYLIILGVHSMIQEENSVFGGACIGHCEKRGSHEHVSNYEKITELELFEFYVHMPGHRRPKLIFIQLDATIYSFIIAAKLLYMFRVASLFIIRSTYNCIHSIW